MAMNDEGQALSTLGEPLTGMVQPAATPSAVDQLVDAFHKGFITSNDILAHSGALAAAQGQNALDVLKIQPDIIQAQKAQANLSTAQSQAQLAAVQPLAKLQQTQISRQTADVNGKAAEDAYEAAGLPQIYTAEGAVDHVAKQAAGGKLLQGQRQVQIGNAMLAGAQPVQMWDEKAGGLVNVMWSPTYGNVTPPIGSSPGSPTWQRAHDLITSGTEILTDPTLVNPSGIPAHLQPAAPAVAPAAVAPVAPVAPAVTPAQVSAATAPPVSVVPIAGAVPGLPSASDPSAYAAWRASTGQAPIGPAVVPSTTTITHPDGTTIQQTTPPPATAAAVQPAAQTPSMPSWPVAPHFDVAQKIIGDMRNQEFYKNWAEKHPAISRLRQIEATPATGITTQDDHDLAISVAQLVSPSTSLRGGGDVGQTKSIEDAIPILERLANIKGSLLKTEAYPPETRKRLIAVGERAAQSLENDARSAMRGAVPNLHIQAAMPREYIPSLFNPAELSLMQGGGGSSTVASGAARPAQTYTLSTGRKVVVQPTGP